MRGIFDTHAHYDDRAFDEDREEILAQLKEQGYSGIVDIGASFESCKKAVEISNTHDIVYATVGIHPDCIEDFFEGENNRNTSGNRVIEEMYKDVYKRQEVDEAEAAIFEGDAPDMTDLFYKMLEDVDKHNLINNENK